MHLYFPGISGEGSGGVQVGHSGRRAQDLGHDRDQVRAGVRDQGDAGDLEEESDLGPAQTLLHWHQILSA